MLNLQMDQLSDTKAIGLFRRAESCAVHRLFHESSIGEDLGRVEIAECLKGTRHDSFATYSVVRRHRPCSSYKDIPSVWMPRSRAD